MSKAEKKPATPPRKARRGKAVSHRLTRLRTPGGGSQGSAGRSAETAGRNRNVALDCGWGRLLFTPTFDRYQDLLAALREEAPDTRDIAFHVGDPHVLLAQAPQEIFLDPSHTFRLDLSTYRAGGRRPKGVTIRRFSSEGDAAGINAVYANCGMVQVREDFFAGERDNRPVTYFVAQDDALFKRLQCFAALLLEADGDEHVEVQAELLGVEQGHVLADQASRLQRTHPRQTGRG